MPRSDRLRLTRLLRPRLDAPLPNWTIFPVIFVALYVSHFSLLRIPYYWDEAGYYIPAAWDFFRTGSLIPTTTLNNAHPPLPSICLALWWKLSGFSPEMTREAVLMVASLGLLAVWRLAIRLTGVASVAFWTVVLTGIYPIWFAQSSLAHADIFAAACTLWGLVYTLPERDRRPGIAALWFAAAALSKETAIVIPLALAAVSFVESFRTRGTARARLWCEAAWLSACVLPLIGWYVWHYAKTGYFFGTPDYLRYNAVATLSPVRILAAFGHRVLDLTAHMNLFVPVLMAFAALLLPPLPDAEGHDRATISFPVRRSIFVLLLVNAVLFSVLGGALLNRYLLPMYPLVLLLAVSIFYRRVPYWHGLAIFSATAFLVGLFVNPPYGFAPEDNLAYAHVVRMHLAGIAQLNKRYPDATVLTAWPMTDELTRPELGYLKQPFDVCAIDNFTAAQIARAAAEPEKYSVALVFSTKYDPPAGLFSLGAKSEALDERFFGLYHDLPPQVIAQRLGGTLVWQSDDDGMWIALIRFNRQFETRLQPGGHDLLPAVRQRYIQFASEYIHRAQR
ncbi:MAG: glycosyltransferase family 39 protein [Acidobacteriota bacterium]|nr:glycosyltransferase family 39 protein [Acidobacteriota bacterium]